MGVPLRKPPPDWEVEIAPGSTDPFRYGSRWRKVRLPNGEVTEEQVPLTAEDLLNPELGDEVTQSEAHFEFLHWLTNLLLRHYRTREDIKLAGDMKMFWGIPGLKEPSPDIAIIQGVRKKFDMDRGSFDVVEEGVRPCLIIEVVSATDSEVRRNDYEKKVEIYQRAGIPEYLICDPPTSVTRGRLLLTGYRLRPNGQYGRSQPDAQGRLLSETTGLLFGVGDDGQSLSVFDTRTGEWLVDADELATREAEARKAAEAEVARLRAELEKIRKSNR
ncbi:MAG: Uma2 family endonuclease [Thermoanaerobaculia bacterium]